MREQEIAEQGNAARNPLCPRIVGQQLGQLVLEDGEASGLETHDSDGPLLLGFQHRREDVDDVLQPGFGKLQIAEVVQRAAAAQAPRGQDRLETGAVIGAGNGHWLGLTSHLLMEEHLLPVISPALAESQPIATPVDLARHLLLVVTGRPLVWRQWFHKHDLPDAAMRLGPQFELTSHAVQAVAAGLGVGLVPSCLVEEELRDGTLKPAIASPLQTGLSYYFFVSPLKADLPHISAFKSWLMDAKTEANP